MMRTVHLVHLVNKGPTMSALFLPANAFGLNPEES